MNDDRPRTVGSTLSGMPAQRASASPVNGRIRGSLWKTVFAASLINALALFDFILFGSFASILGDRFFPFTSQAALPLLVAATAGVSLLARPLGAIVLGAYADRSDRQRALLLSCWLATAGTATFALAPDYAQIGVAAPLIAIAARALQGFALGGETGAASALVMEVSPPRRRALLLGCQLAGNGLAWLLAASVGALMSALLSPANLFSWGWRVAFAIGLPLPALVYYLKRQLGEPARAPQSVAPVAGLGREHRGTVIAGTLLMAFRTAPLYAAAYFLPAYMARPVHGPAQSGFAAAALCALVLTILAPLSGAAIDAQARRKPLLAVSIAGTAVCVYLVFHGTIPTGNATLLLTGIAIMTAIVVLGACAATVLVLEALPQNVRATGYGTAYALGTALFGSSAPFVIMALMKWTANPMWVAWYVIACCALSALAAIALKGR